MGECGERAEEGAGGASEAESVVGAGPGRRSFQPNAFSIPMDFPSFPVILISVSH